MLCQVHRLPRVNGVQLFNGETGQDTELGIGVALDEANGNALTGAWLKNPPGTPNSRQAHIFDLSMIPAAVLQAEEVTTKSTELDQ